MADGPATGGQFSLLSGTVRPQTDGWATTQIYEGTNQIQRMVIAKRLLA